MKGCSPSTKLRSTHKWRPAMAPRSKMTGASFFGCFVRTPWKSHRPGSVLLGDRDAVADHRLDQQMHDIGQRLVAIARQVDHGEDHFADASLDPGLDTPECSQQFRRGDLANRLVPDLKIELSEIPSSVPAGSSTWPCSPFRAPWSPILPRLLERCASAFRLPIAWPRALRPDLGPDRVALLRPSAFRAGP